MRYFQDDDDDARRFFKKLEKFVKKFLIWKKNLFEVSISSSSENHLRYSIKSLENISQQKKTHFKNLQNIYQ